jgi:hypothetical protein
METGTAIPCDAWIRQPTQQHRDSELLSRVTRGFDSPHSPLGNQKLLSRVTRGFYSPDSPLWSEKS